MMKKGLYGICALAALLLAGCSADRADGGDGGDGDVPIYLTATITEGGGVAGTRAGADLQTTQLASGVTFRAEFTGSDVSVGTTNYVTDGSGGTSVASGSAMPYFKFGGTSTTVNAYYPSSVNSATTSFSVATDQSTDEGYLASDLMYATTDISKVFPVTTAALQFTHRMAKIQINITMGSGITAISSVKIIGGQPTATLTAGTAMPTGTATGTAFSTSNPLVVFDGSTEAYTTVGTPLACAALIPPQPIAAGAFLQVETNGGTATFSLAAEKTFATGQRYLYNIALTMATIGTTTTITDWTADGSALLINGNGLTLNEKPYVVPATEAVDLGLSVKWALRNIGATTETDYGYYFQWGDSEDKSSATCDWSNYKWSNDTGNLFSKYIPSDKAGYWGGEGDPDNKSVLDASDDAAYMAWGGKWRMPTRAEMQELLNGCNKIEYFGDTKYNGVNGILLTSKTNNNSIFLPAAGYRRNTSTTGTGTLVGCWSSSLTLATPSYAVYLRSTSGNANVEYGYDRFLGFTVRAVLDN